MTNITEEFGKHAGTVWKTLNTYGPLPETKLKETTRFHEHEFYVAVGWLARENKICKEGSVYRLGETNLTDKIGADAGKVWNLLETQGKVDIHNIKNHLQIDEKDAYSALGWLARENKIETTRTIPKKYHIKSK